MYGLLGIIVIIGIISVALPIIFPSLLTGSITFFLALKPEDHAGWVFYAELLVKQRQYLEAIDAYRIAAKLRPDISEIWMKLGNILTRLGQFDEADRAFQTGLGSGIL
ncbi:MAG: tetratricopeptide repeat protein [Promethearchaeota archaeon]